MGHIAKDFWFNKNIAESNTVTSCSKKTYEDEWEIKASFEVEEQSAFIVIEAERIDYEKDWIVDLGCSNHMTGDKQKLHNLTRYKGNRVVTTNNSRLPIAHIGQTVITPRYNPNQSH